MASHLKWWLIHALHWAVLYCGFIAELEGAMYVLKFCVWGALLLTAVILTEDVIAHAAKQPVFPWRRGVSSFQSWVTLGFLVWFGHIATAIAWVIVMGLMFIHRDMVEKYRAKTA